MTKIRVGFIPFILNEDIGTEGPGAEYIVFNE